MHELSIAENLLEIVDKYRVEKEFARCRSIRLRIGLLAAVDEDALRFAVECLTEGGPDTGVALEVEKTWPTAQCACGNSFEVQDLLYLCGRCGSTSARLSGGDELDILHLEVD